MTLGIGDGLFIRSLVGEFPPYSAHTPVLVPEFLYPLDPVVGDSHSHSEVEAHAIGLEWGGEACHSADVFRYCDGIRVKFVDEHIRQSEVTDGIFIHPVVEVEGIISEVLAQAVIPIDHTGYAVETEAVQMIFLHPVFAVGEQEVLYLVLTVIEAAGPPGRVVALVAFVEIEVVPAIEAAQALGFIYHGMGMDYVHNDRNSAGVGIIHETLEVFGRAEAGAQGEEIGHLIAERAVVRVLLQRHNLQNVVSQGLDPWKHGSPELLEAGHFLLFGAHAYVTLVNQRMRALARIAVFPLVWFRIPNLGTEDLRFRVLHHPRRICRKPFSSTSGPLYPELVQISVMKADSRQPDLPVTLAHRLQGITVGALPIVEFPDKIDTAGIRRPFAQNPFGSFLMQRVVKMVVDCRA